MSDFKGRHFEGEIVLWTVRWYCRYPISDRDLESRMTERGVAVDHSTIFRWVQRFASEMEKRLRWQRRRPRSGSWRVDETCVKVRGKWACLYRAVDKFGDTIDFYLSKTRNTTAAERFLGKALRGCKGWELPEVVNTDKAPAYAAAIAELEADDLLFLPRGVWHCAQSVGIGILHLTFGLKRRTGIDYVEWLIQKATAHRVFRADLPFLESTELQDARTRELRDKFVGILMDHGIDSYRRFLASQASERTSVYMDTSLSLVKALRDKGARVSLASKRAVINSVSSEGFEISANGKCWRLSSKIYVIFEFLDRNERIVWKELCDLVEEEDLFDTVGTLETLWMDGLLIVDRR